jgi:hypothetical protein
VILRDNHSMCVGVPLGSFLLGHYSAATRGGQNEETANSLPVALITFSLGVISGTVFRTPVPLPSQR